MDEKPPDEKPPTFERGPYGRSESLDQLADWVVRNQFAVWDAVEGIPGQPQAGVMTAQPVYIEKAVAKAHFYMVETLRLSIERLVVSNNDSTRIMSRLTKAYVALTAAIVFLTLAQVILALLK